MARFEMELPTEVMAEIESVYFDTDKIFGGMTKAAAKAVEQQVKANVPAGMRKSNIMKTLKVTRTYKTPTDDGINTKVGFYGYFKDEDGRIKPAPLVANMFEYGSSKRATGSQTRPPKQPFFRKAFSKSTIEATMMAEQKKLTGGLLDE